MMEISETLFYAVCALPVLGFALGALWMREQQRQDFTERLMTQDRRQAPRRGDTPIPTPV